MTDPDVKQLLSGEGNAWIDDLLPVRVAGIEQHQHDGILRLLNSVSGKVHIPDQMEGVIWELANGEQSLGAIRKIVHQETSDDFDEITLQMDIAIDRLAIQNLLTFNKINSYDFPVEIDTFTHIVTTRGGLYLVNKEKYLQIAQGMFFGICFDDQGDVLVYDFPHRDSSVSFFSFEQAKKTNTCEGRVRRFKIIDGKIHAPLDYVDNLPNNVHYIKWKNNRLFIVDCENQKIEVIDRLNKQLQVPVFTGSYHHINTIALEDNHYWVVKCVGSNGSKDSSVGIFDDQWQQVADLPLSAKRAHDLYFEPGSQVESPLFWVCDSTDGYLVHYPDGYRIKIRTEAGHGGATRGLDLCGNEWVVGSGFIKPYYRMKNQFRHRGIIQWLNKDSGELTSALALPEPPCCILQLLENKRVD